MDARRVFEDDEFDTGLSFEWRGSATINVFADGEEVDMMTRYGEDGRGGSTYTPSEEQVEEAVRDYIRDASEGWR
ncbi:MAG: hypothetical protein WCJ13_09520 [Coriobacteriia bacterium]